MDIPSTVDSKKPVGSELERTLLQTYLHRLGGSYYRHQHCGSVRNRRARQITSLNSSVASGITTSSAGNGATLGVLDNSQPQPQTFWRNSTILPAHSDSVFYQQVECGSSLQHPPPQRV